MEAIAQLKQDITAALKAGDRERVTALRLVLSELQKEEKEGKGDELAVLRRERKRRLEAVATFRDAGREDLAEQNEREAALIEGYLPTELSDAELDAIVADAVERSGASSRADMGKVMGQAMAAVAGRADGKRVSARVGAALDAVTQ